MNFGDSFIGIVQLRKCSISEGGKIALGDSPARKAVANTFKQHQRAFALSAIAPAIAALAL